MTRIDIINRLAKKHNYTTYLELGVQGGVSFKNVDILHKTGVDPDVNSGADHKTTSDKFFNMLGSSIKYDLIFIDGLHHADQAYKDIVNSLKHLSDNGTIVVHDCSPTSEAMQEVPRIQKEWTGNVWEAIVKVRSEMTDVSCTTVDTDYGCCIIRKEESELITIKGKINYDNLVKNRKEWLNLISPKDFLSMMGDDTSYNIYEFIPYSIEKDYGKACNECFDLIPNDNDWGVVRDTDCLSLTPSHIHMVRRAIEMHPDTGMFIATTNRVGQKRQVHDMKLFDNMDVNVHRNIALELSGKPLTFTEFDIPISGYFMCIKKSVLKEAGGFKSGILGVDTNISNRIRRLSKKILMINNLYMFHYYRGVEGIHSKEHIK